MQTAIPTSHTAPVGDSVEPPRAFLVTGRHTTPYRELEAPLPSGRILLFQTPAASVLQIPASETDCLCLVPLEGGGRFLHDGIETPLRGFSISPAGRGGIFRTTARGAFAILAIRQSLVRSFPDWQTFTPLNQACVVAKVELPPAFQIPAAGRAPVLESSTAAELARHAAPLETLFLLSSPSGSAEPDSLRGPRRSNTRAEIVHCIWDMVRADTTNDRPLEEWGRITGTSSRTLEYAFAEIVGLSPMAFIRAWRFAKARSLLLEKSVRTVKDAAYGCGLMHLGRFSIDYRLQFGESPSETLGVHRPKPTARILVAPSLEFALAKNTIEPEILPLNVTLSSSG